MQRNGSWDRIVATVCGLAAAAVVWAAGPASGQVDPDAGNTGPAEALVKPEVPAPPSDPDVRAVYEGLIGTWMTEDTDPDTGDAVQVAMHVAPVRVIGVLDTLYAEITREGNADAPHRQVIFQVYRYRGDKVRVRTMEFRRFPDASAVLTGLWLAPEYLPPVKREDLIATLDIELSKAGGGWAGKTAWPYPTATAGAVDMTSSLKIERDRLETTDQWIDAEGRVVQGKESGYRWARSRPTETAHVSDDGLITIDLMPGHGDPAPDGNMAQFHFSAWLLDGTVVDSSKSRNQPMRSPVPWDVGMEGMKRGTSGLRAGQVRRLVIPPSLGFGDEVRGRVPAGATLIVEIELLGHEPPQKPPTPGDQPVPIDDEMPANDAPPAGGGGGR